MPRRRRLRDQCVHTLKGMRHTFAHAFANRCPHGITHSCTYHLANANAHTTHASTNPDRRVRSRARSGVLQPALRPVVRRQGAGHQVREWVGRRAQVLRLHVRPRLLPTGRPVAVPAVPERLVLGPEQDGVRARVPGLDPGRARARRDDVRPHLGIRGVPQPEPGLRDAGAARGGRGRGRGRGRGGRSGKGGRRRGRRKEGEQLPPAQPAGVVHPGRP